jgi:cytochrome c5
MKHLEGKMFGLLLLAATFAIGGAVAVSQTEGTPQPPRTKATTKNVHAANQDRGQRVFEENCARCHNAPEGFSPNISGTVAMHMRVRAGLSDADVKALLKFLNP